jgi:branched-chain amino acid transport system substrate-binding protein
VFPKLAGVSWVVFSVAYHNAMEAVLTALEQVGGDLSGDQQRFRDALASLELQAPQGTVRLDQTRRAVGPNYLLKVAGGAKGQLSLAPFRSVPNVEPTFGGYFKPSAPIPSSTTPACVKRTPPQWAR